MNSIRNTFVTLGLASVLLSGAAFAEEDEITVYKTPTCNCCGKWVSHLEESGFKVKTVDMRDLRMVKSMSGITPQLASCHTAKVGGYVIEGHVPAGDIRRLLAEHPDVTGLAAPGMPQSSPGMDMGSAPYQVLSFDKNGHTEVFARH